MTILVVPADPTDPAEDGSGLHSSLPGTILDELWVGAVGGEHNITLDR